MSTEDATLLDVVPTGTATMDTIVSGAPRITIPPEPDDPPLPPGTRAGDHALIERLASGGCGTVYRARHVETGAPAAVKVLERDLAKSPEMVLRFLREAHAVNTIGHPNIVKIEGCGLIEGGPPYLLMELLTGRDLAHHVSRSGRLSPTRCLEIVEPVGRALHAAHQAGFVHRDVKASNVFLAVEGGREIVKLLDFGIAKLLHLGPDDLALTRTRRVLGSVQTMAPEQLRATEVTPATDVYGLGAVIFLLLVGRYPFAGLQTAELERRILDCAPPRPSDLAPTPPALDAVVARCLEKRPEDRYASVAQLLDDLRAATTSLTPTPVVQAPASALYVDVRMAPGADLDDAFEAVDDALERADKALGAAGFKSVVATGSSLLVVRPHEAADDPATRLLAARTAAELAAALGGSPDAALIEVAVTVHAGQVRMAHGRPIGGALLEVATWAAWIGPGVFATAAAGAAIDEPRVARRG